MSRGRETSVNGCRRQLLSNGICRDDLGLSAAVSLSERSCSSPWPSTSWWGWSLRCGRHQRLSGRRGHRAWWSSSPADHALHYAPPCPPCGNLPQPPRPP